MPTRRNFLKTTAATGLGATLGLNLASCGLDVPYLDTVGLQIWTIRDLLAADPVAALRGVKAAGYRQIELMDTAQLPDLLPIAQDLGLAVNSSFINWSAVTGRWDLRTDNPTPVEFEAIVAEAKRAGLSDLVFGYVMKGNRERKDDYKRLADQLNRAGELAQSAGIQLSYHNHSFEFEPLADAAFTRKLAAFDDYKYGYEILMDRVEDPLCRFEVDVFWVALGGEEPQKVINRLGERTHLLHLKDLNPTYEEPIWDEGAVPEDAFQELGDGEVDIVRCMNLGKTFGVKYCFVEQDQSPAPLESIAQSRTYLDQRAAS